MSKLTALIKTIAKESWQLNEVSSGGTAGAAPKFQTRGAAPQAPQQWTPPVPAVAPTPSNSMGPGRSAAGPAPSRGPSPEQQRSNYSSSVANAPTPNLNAVERGQRVNSMGPSAGSGSAGVATIPKPPVAPVMGSTNNVGAPGSKLANKAAGVLNRSSSTQVAGASATRPATASPVTVNPVQQTHSTQAPVEPVKAAPGTSSSQKAVANRPAQRMSKPVQNRLPRKPRPNIGTASAGMNTNQITMRGLSGMNEENVPIQVKESFEKFLRNHFLTG